MSREITERWLTELINAALRNTYLILFRAIPLFFLWNIGLANGFGAPQLSFTFFVCLVAFIRVIMFSEQIQRVNKELIEIKALSSLHYALMMTYIPSKMSQKTPSTQLNEESPTS